MFEKSFFSLVNIPNGIYMCVCVTVTNVRIVAIKCKTIKSVDIWILF